MYKFGIAIFMVIVCACGRNPNGAIVQEDDAHLQDDEASQTTLFTENTEFYIEFQPLEAGEESEFLVHVTNLQTYKPYASGNVTIEIDGASVTSGKPDPPGIFHVPFIPVKEGAFHVTFTFRTGDITETVTDHVHIYEDHEQLHSPDAAADEHSHDIELGEISFLKEQAWKSDFMVRELHMSPFSSVIPTSGEIMAVPGMKKSVAAPSGGIVIFANGKMVQGSQVTKGELLFTLSSKTLIDNNVALRLQESLNELNNSRSEYLRHLHLYENRVISQRQLLASESSYNTDSLSYYSLANNATKEGLKVFSPIAGYIHELNVSEGEYIETGQTLVTISSDRELLIRADLPQQFFQQLNEIETANFRPAYTDQTYSIEQFKGRLLATGSSVAENDHYLPVYFRVENDGRLLEGAFAEFFLKTSRKESCISVPMNALIEEHGNYYVYVQVTGESFTKRAVSPGKNDGQQVEILSGLSESDRVVTYGMMLVKAASVVTGVVGHGHAH